MKVFITGGVGRSRRPGGAAARRAAFAGPPPKGAPSVRTSISYRALVTLLELTGVKKRQFHPARFSGSAPGSRGHRPPARRKGVVITEQALHGWPVFHVSPRDAAEPVRRVLYIHGGAWAAEIGRAHWRLVAELARRSGREVIVPIYPKVPSATHADVLPTLAVMFRELAADASATALVGDSAGAHIALSVLLSLPGDAPRPDLTVLLSPAVDLALDNPDIDAVSATDPLLNADHVRALAGLWAGPAETDAPVLNALRADLGGLGRVHVYAATRDILSPDTLRLVARLRIAAGTEVVLHTGEGMVHDWMLLPVPEGRDARRSIAALLT